MRPRGLLTLDEMIMFETSPVGRGTRLRGHTMALTRATYSAEDGACSPRAEPPILSRPRSSTVELPACTREASVQFRTWAPGFCLLVNALHATRKCRFESGPIHRGSRRFTTGSVA